jgi:hypothetical protein
MPVTIPRDLPAAEVLKQENIFFMTKEQAIHQDIRPLQVAAQPHAEQDSYGDNSFSGCWAIQPCK